MDNTTAVEWQAEGLARMCTWEEAHAYAAALGDGWRLPTLPELLSLMSDAPHAADAWFVHFAHGAFIYGGDTYMRVRCVRNA